MNRIDKAFAELKAAGKKALITFVTAGDPDLDTTEKAVIEMFGNGADIIELGVPFSDPVAEGPVIQEASLRSLEGGTNLDKIFGIVINIRRKTDKPLLLMMYLNTIFRYGTERFFEKCRMTGIDGVIIPDMPYEEKDEVSAQAKANGVYSISLVTPVSKGRIGMIAKESEGFLYCVSSTGVTGMRSGFSTDFGEFFGEVYKYAKIPCCVGFGISNPEQAKKMSEYCDGVIIGSAVVKLAAEHGKDYPAYAGGFVRDVRAALDK